MKALVLDGINSGVEGQKPPEPRMKWFLESVFLIPAVMEDLSSIPLAECVDVESIRNFILQEEIVAIHRKYCEFEGNIEQALSDAAQNAYVMDTLYEGHGITLSSREIIVDKYLEDKSTQD